MKFNMRFYGAYVIAGVSIRLECHKVVDIISANKVRTRVSHWLGISFDLPNSVCASRLPRSARSAFTEVRSRRNRLWSPVACELTFWTNGSNACEMVSEGKSVVPRC